MERSPGSLSSDVTSDVTSHLFCNCMISDFQQLIFVVVVFFNDMQYFPEVPGQLYHEVT